MQSISVAIRGRRRRDAAVAFRSGAFCVHRARQLPFSDRRFVLMLHCSVNNPVGREKPPLFPVYRFVHCSNNRP